MMNRVEPKHYTLEEMERYVRLIIDGFSNLQPTLAEIMLKQAVEMLRSQSAT
jgi:hypothetical protein